MDQEMFQAIERHMHICMNDSAHDKEHIYRVLYAAADIATHETAPLDRDVLTAACLLHDIGREDQFRDPSVCHALAGSQKAYHFLKSLDWSEEQAVHVRACILTHRFRTDQRPATLEAKILFDADKLDVTGAIGIARTLFYGGQISQPLYQLGPDGSILTAPDLPPSFFREFNYKLRQIGAQLYTNRARKLAAERQAAATAYYDALLGEVQACYTQGKQVLDRWMEETDA